MRYLLSLYVLCFCLPVWAGSVRDLAWSEMVPPGAPRLAQPVVSHDGVEKKGVLGPQTMPNAPVVADLEGVLIKLPGYVVPLETDAKGQVTEFLLVPYFGACIHVPPPPSNQIVHVRYPQGVVQEALYQPFWVEGPLRVMQTRSDLAETGYAMQADRVYPYELSGR